MTRVAPPHPPHRRPLLHCFLRRSPGQPLIESLHGLPLQKGNQSRSTAARSPASIASQKAHNSLFPPAPTRTAYMQCPFRKLAVRIMANIASQHPPGQPTGSAPSEGWQSKVPPYSRTESPQCILYAGTRQESHTESPHALNMFVYVCDSRHQHSLAEGRLAHPVPHREAMLHCFFRHSPGQPFRKPTWSAFSESRQAKVHSGHNSRQHSLTESP